jgi:hypothetical protein
VSPAGTAALVRRRDDLAIPGAGADTAIDLFMLMCFGGRERTVDELAGLGADCGLVLRRSAPVADGRTALELGVAASAVAARD